MDYWDWKSLDDDFYRPDPEEPGSWIELYWWRVITKMYNEWQAEKYKRDEGDEKPVSSDGLKRRDPNAPRKKPVLPSQRKR